MFFGPQIGRPWEEDTERQLIQDALEQIELADSLGFSHVWEVEHHFLEEYSHSSAPEVFLAAASQRTRQIRLGHGIVLTAPTFNTPGRPSSGARSGGNSPIRRCGGRAPAGTRSCSPPKRASAPSPSPSSIPRR